MIGGGFGIGVRTAVLEPALEVVRRDALTPASEQVRVVPASSAPPLRLAGACLRGGVGAARRLRVRSEPRGRDAPACLRAARGRPRALRGHETDAGALLRATGSTALNPPSYHRHNEGSADGGGAARLLEGARVVASDAGLPGRATPVADRGLQLQRGGGETAAPAAGSGGRVVQRASRSSGGSSSRVCRAASGPSRRCGASSRPGAMPSSPTSRRSSAALAGPRMGFADAAVAVCRE